MSAESRLAKVKAPNDCSGCSNGENTWRFPPGTSRSLIKEPRIVLDWTGTKLELLFPFLHKSCKLI